MRPGAEVGARAEQDQVVGARADHDLLPVDVGPTSPRDVARGRLAQLPVRPVGVLVQRREALGERHLRDTRQRRRVLVELQHLCRGEAVAGGHLGDARRPGVRRELVRERDRVGPPPECPWRGRRVVRAVVTMPPYRTGRPRPAGDGAGARRRCRRAPSSRCGGVERQPLGARDGADDASRGGGPGRRRADDLQRLHERLEAEAAGGARETARRQDVRRTGGVVADDGRAADEHGAGVANPRERARSGSATWSSRCSGANASERASASASESTVSTVMLSYRATRLATRVGQRRVGAEQDRLAVGPVLCLREQVGGAGLRRRPSRRRSRSPRSARPGRSIPTWLETSSFAAVT